MPELSTFVRHDSNLAHSVYIFMKTMTAMPFVGKIVLKKDAIKNIITIFIYPKTTIEKENLFPYYSYINIGEKYIVIYSFIWT